jgi:hypothetical protein
MRVEGDTEILELGVKNNRATMAFPCEAHPPVSYRTESVSYPREGGKPRKRRRVINAAPAARGKWDGK